MSTSIAEEKLVLQQAYDKEKNRSGELYITQPIGGGVTERYTWGRFMEETRRVASFLKSQNYPPKSHIALISKNCAQFLMTELAIWMAGHVSVALYPTLNGKTVKYILNHSEAKMLFVGKLDQWENIQSSVPEDMLKIAFPLAPKNDFTNWNDLLGEYEPMEGNPVRKADEMALIMYTSGTTGQPKGVMHSFGGISSAAQLIIKALSITKEDRMLSYLPLAHALERWLVGTSGLVAGFQIFFAESLKTFVADIQRARPTLFISVPRLWLKFQTGIHQKMSPQKLNFLLKIPIFNRVIQKKILTALGLQDARIAGSGSAPISTELLYWYRNLGLELLEGYGMSENYSCSHLNMPGRALVGTVGTPYPSVECKLSEEGEILVKSPADMMGYYKLPELSKESFTDDGFLKTGDRGSIDGLGYLKITGRTKELFKTSKGKYVAPAPIENMINNHKDIELSCVSGSGQPKAYAAIMLSEKLYENINDSEFRTRIEGEFKDLLKNVNSQVEKFEQLQFLAIANSPWTIEADLLTPTQKIKRANIEAIFEPKLEDWYSQSKKIVWQ